MRTIIVILIGVLAFSSSFLLPQAQNELGELKTRVEDKIDNLEGRILGKLHQAMIAHIFVDGIVAGESMTGVEAKAILLEFAPLIGIDTTFVTHPHASALEELEAMMIRAGLTPEYAAIAKGQIANTGEWQEVDEGE